MDIGPRETIDGMLLVGLLGAFAYALSQRVPPGRDVVRAGLITLALAIASEDALPYGAPAQGAPSSHETG